MRIVILIENGMVKSVWAPLQNANVNVFYIDDNQEKRDLTLNKILEVVKKLNLTEVY